MIDSITNANLDTSISVHDYRKKYYEENKEAFKQRNKQYYERRKMARAADPIANARTTVRSILVQLGNNQIYSAHNYLYEQRIVREPQDVSAGRIKLKAAITKAYNNMTMAELEHFIEFLRSLPTMTTAPAQ